MGALSIGPGVWSRLGLGLSGGAALTNLLTNEDALDNAAWVKIRSTVTADALTTGGYTFDKLVEDTTATATHTIQQDTPLVSGQTYTQTFVAKAGERTVVRLIVGAAVGGGSYNFDLSTGTATLSGAGVISVANTDSLGGGIYRLRVRFTPTSSASNGITVAMLNAGVAGYTGDGASGVYITRGRLVQGVE